MDIRLQLKQAILAYYTRAGIKSTFVEAVDFHLLLTDYFEVLRKHIPQRSRRVHISKELQQKAASTSFKDWRNRFYELRDGFANGKDMNVYLSRLADYSSFRDRLLTCWGMHHLHFYPEKTRGDMLLFAMVRDDDIYLVDVIPHNKKYVFSTYSLLETAYHNWKPLLEPYRLKGVQGIEYVIRSDEDINKMRKGGVSTAMQLDNDFYCLDMMSTDGHGAMDVLRAGQICNSIALNEKRGTFKHCRLVNFSLTLRRKPCFVASYIDGNGYLQAWAL